VKRKNEKKSIIKIKKTMSMKRIILQLMFVSAMMTFSMLSNGQNTSEVPKDTVSPKVEELKTEFHLFKTDLEIFKRLKISGYIQGQFQIAEQQGIKSYEGGDFSPISDKRFMIRRGRVKVAYETEITSAAIQIDATEKGVSLKDAYLSFREPWLKMFGITAGVFNRPFGYEIGYSSSLRESPERGRMSQILFPGERDLGAMLTINPWKTSRFNGIKLDAGLFSGNGINPDFKEMKDLITHLTYAGSTKNEFFKYGVGISYYLGGVYQGSKKIYSMATLDDGTTMGFAVDSTSTNKGQYAKREYYGADLQLTFAFPFGITQLRGEFIMGQQPAYDGAGSTSTNDATFAKTPPTKDTYVRKFNGAYFYFVQNIMQSKFGVFAKYDWYTPNTEVSGDAINPNYTFNSVKYKTYLSSADIKYTTLGFGANFKMTENIKLTAYYAIVRNEGTMCDGYYTDVKDNVFTLRAQFKF
jgi:hypothetical protein